MDNEFIFSVSNFQVEIPATGVHDVVTDTIDNLNNQSDTSVPAGQGVSNIVVNNAIQFSSDNSASDLQFAEPAIIEYDNSHDVVILSMIYVFKIILLYVIVQYPPVMFLNVLAILPLNYHQMLINKNLVYTFLKSIILTAEMIRTITLFLIHYRSHEKEKNIQFWKKL